MIKMNTNDAFLHIHDYQSYLQTHTRTDTHTRVIQNDGKDHLDEPSPSEQLKRDRLVKVQWKVLDINLNNSHLLLGQRDPTKH